MSETTPSGPPAGAIPQLKQWTRHWARVALAGFLCAHFIWLCHHVEYAYASPDADGYFAQARLIAETGQFTFAAESPVQYLGMHWLEVRSGAFISRYPMGFPLLMVPPWVVFGRDAAFLVNPLLATLTLFLLFLLCRRWASEPLALAAVLVLGLNPVFNGFTLMYFAHTAAAFVLLLGFRLLVLWSDQGSAWIALSAGLVLGFLPLVRYAEAAAGLGIAVFLGATMITRPDRRMSGFLVGAGALLPLLILLLFNQAHFDAFWKTAYALTGEQSLSLRYLPDNWAGYLKSLMTDGAGLLFVPGIIGLIGMTLAPRSRWAGLSMLTVCLGLVFVYACYYFSSGRAVAGGNVRFLIPVFPFLLIGSMFFLDTIEPRRLRTAALAVIVGLQSLLWAGESVRRIDGIREAASRSAAVLAWLEERVPPGAIVVGDPQLHQQIHFTGLWKLADRRVFSRNSPRQAPFAGIDRDRPLMRPFMTAGETGEGDGEPSPAQPDKARALRQDYAGLDEADRALLGWVDILDWAHNERPVYWVGEAGSAADFAYRLGLPAEAEPAATLVLPGEAGGRGSSLFERIAARQTGGLFGLRPGQELELVQLDGR